MDTAEIVTTPTWRSDWERAHQAITGRPPRRQHLTLARCLYLAEVDARAAAFTTAAAALYDRALGANAEATSQQLRKVILWAALSRAA